MMSTLAEGRHVAMDPDFWVRAFRARRRMCEQLHAGLAARTDSDPEMSVVLSTVRDEVHRELRIHEQVWARRFSEFIRSWEQDLGTWGERLEKATVHPARAVVCSGEFVVERSLFVGALTALHGDQRPASPDVNAESNKRARRFGAVLSWFRPVDQERVESLAPVRL
jgi:hypothetical protein